MATFESIQRLLQILDAREHQTMAEIRDGLHGMASEATKNIRKALTEMSALRQQVYQIKPQLQPDKSQPPCECSAADRLLVESMAQAAEQAHAGNPAGAIATLEEFLRAEPSPWHREIAAEELQRLRPAATGPRP